MNLNDNAAVRQILSATEAIGAKLPKAVADSHAAMSKLMDGADHLPMGQELAAVVADAIEADRDPTTDPAVLHAVVARQVGADGMARQVGAVGLDRFREVCRKHADDIIHAWGKPFDQAAETLREAHRHLGDIDLADTSTVLAKGGSVAEVWTGAQRAVRTIDTAVTAWATLGAFIHAVSVPGDKRHSAKRFCDPDYRTHGGLEAPLTPWTALIHGVPLSLPTYSEYKRRVSAWVEAAAAPEMVVDKERSAIAGREIRVPSY